VDCPQLNTADSLSSPITVTRCVYQHHSALTALLSFPVQQTGEGEVKSSTHPWSCLTTAVSTVFDRMVIGHVVGLRPGITRTCFLATACFVRASEADLQTLKDESRNWIQRAGLYWRQHNNNHKQLTSEHVGNDARLFVTMWLVVCQW